VADQQGKPCQNKSSYLPGGSEHDVLSQDLQSAELWAGGHPGELDGAGVHAGMAALQSMCTYGNAVFVTCRSPDRSACIKLITDTTSLQRLIYLLRMVSWAIGLHDDGVPTPSEAREWTFQQRVDIIQQLADLMNDMRTQRARQINPASPDMHTNGTHGTFPSATPRLFASAVTTLKQVHAHLEMLQPGAGDRIMVQAINTLHLESTFALSRTKGTDSHKDVASYLHTRQGLVKERTKAHTTAAYPRPPTTKARTYYSDTPVAKLAYRELVAMRECLPAAVRYRQSAKKAHVPLTFEPFLLDASNEGSALEAKHAARRSLQQTAKKRRHTHHIWKSAVGLEPTSTRSTRRRFAWPTSVKLAAHHLRSSPPRPSTST
jgi:hypothetical protein